MIDKALVEACYRAILGREPESEAVLADKIRWCTSPEDLISDLMGSPEFLASSVPQIHDYHREPPLRIDVDMSADQRALLFNRLQNQWRALGDRDPFWSVITQDKYRAERIDNQALEEFYATGLDHADLMARYCAHNGVAAPRGICLELGAGVGRVTKHLAARFEKVIAVDISEGNQQHSIAMAQRTQLTNIEHVTLRSPDDIEKLPSVDAFFSVMVLQHNPPPIQKYLLDVILSKLTDTGVFLYQTQSYYRDYTFETDIYLNSPMDIMDMHSLPMRVSFELARKHGLYLYEVIPDMFTGRFGSYTFFGAANA